MKGELREVGKIARRVVQEAVHLYQPVIKAVQIVLREPEPTGAAL